MEIENGSGGKGQSTGTGSMAPGQVAQDLLRYWEGLRYGRIVPLRSDVDPRGLEPILPHAFILERIAPGIARFRIAGQHLTGLMGMEVRGMPLGALLLPEARDRLIALTERVFAEPAMLDLSLRAETGLGRPAMQGRMLILPLAVTSGEITRAVGCLATEGRGIGLTPRRFTMLDAQVSRLGAVSPRSAGAGFAEPPAPFQARPDQPGLTPERRRAMFRVINPDD